MKKNWDWEYILKGHFYSHWKFCGVSGEQMEQAALCWYCLQGLHSNQGEESMWIANVIRILWLYKILSTKDTCLVRRLLSFKFFHRPYQVLELIPCTEHLNSESQKSYFWKLKISHYNCAWIKYTCSKYHLNILEEFHKKLSELQQLEYELKTMSKNGIGQVTCKRQ